jgi:hypothetical protein
MASCSAMRLEHKWAVGYTDDDIHLGKVTPDQQDALNKQFKKNKYAMVQTGADAKWVELPNCGYGTLAGDEVPLKDDLSNAIIATCKAYNPTATAPAPPAAEPPATATYRAQWGKDYNHWEPAPIYDAVMYTSKPLVDHEHQVTQHQDGHIDPTDGTEGPHGDWYMFGKPHGDDQWPTVTYTTMV